MAQSTLKQRTRSLLLEKWGVAWDLTHPIWRCKWSWMTLCADPTLILASCGSRQTVIWRFSVMSVSTWGMVSLSPVDWDRSRFHRSPTTSGLVMPMFNVMIEEPSQKLFLFHWRSHGMCGHSRIKTRSLLDNPRSIFTPNCTFTAVTENMLWVKSWKSTENLQECILFRMQNFSLFGYVEVGSGKSVMGVPRNYCTLNNYENR